MENLITNKLPKPHFSMGKRSNKNDTNCKKHPKHKQSPGVCSLCLREKLTQLPHIGFSTTTTRIPSATIQYSSSDSSSLSSYYYSSSSDSSSCSSPYLRRKSSMSMSMSSLFKRRRSRTNFLTSSTSLALRFRGKDHEGEDDDIKMKKLADGFWSKLLMNRRGKEIVEETLRCSTSTRDQTTISSR